jgi:hypothetical protein
MIRETQAILKENAAGFRELREQSAETDARIAKTEVLVAETTKQLGGMGNSNGAFAEDYFFNALGDTMQFGGQHYDMVDGNLRRNINGVKDQFDVVMYNGTSVAIIEVKYKADAKDVDDLVTRKLKNFRGFFPQYDSCKIYLGLGSMSFDPKVISRAYELGIGILEQKGDTLETDTSHIRAY